ncbi:MAG: SGNH/GDSL hydrolase family protein [Ruminococcaceae bacterium]|nr:SGNH/GDSL hydrolase family protein [Oscillospiraceae bacterium]
MKKISKHLALLMSILMLAMCLSVGASAADKPFYVVLGDSIAYGSGLSNPVDACYGKIIADTCDFDYANHAIPGHTTNNLIARLSEEAVLADVAKADIISISIGGNDFLMNDLVGLMFDSMVKGDYSEFDRIGEGFYANLCEIIRIIRDANDSALILMQTLYNPQQGYLRAPYQQGADRINAAIYRFAEENPGEITVVDAGTALGDDAANFAGDDIHPSAAGNEIIAAEILSTLNEQGVTDKTELSITSEGVDFRISPIFSTMFRMYGLFFHILSVVFGPLFALSK